MFFQILTIDIKTGGTKSKKWRNNEEKKKSATRPSPDASLSTQLTLSATEDTGAKRRRFVQDSAPVLSEQQTLSECNRNRTH